VEELQRRREAAVAGAQRGQAHRYAEAARQAMAQNDPASAANAFRLALSLEPNNPDLLAAHQGAATAAANLLSEGYLKQADYEARAGHWKEAARSYVRAVAGRPEDVSVLQRAAQALMKSGGDLRQAASFAKKSIQLTPGRVDGRIILAEVYLAAGMNLAAKKELDAATELAPHDDRIAVVLKKLK
jgi:tetratricopeptide (TPR) repeat protein